MKEAIKQFCNTLEKALLECVPEKKYSYMRNILMDIIGSDEYQVLKSCIDKPIPKMEITDEQFRKSKEVYSSVIRNRNNTHDEALRAALKAVFASMGKGENMKGNYREIYVLQGFDPEPMGNTMYKRNYDFGEPQAVNIHLESFRLIIRVLRDNKLSIKIGDSEIMVDKNDFRNFIIRILNN